jgi:hypothetical protein
MTIDRKAAAAAWKQRKPSPGIYAIRCTASGEVWVGQFPDLASVRTRHWFALRLGSHANRAMQAAWNTHGESMMLFETLELLKAEEDPVTLSSQLRDAMRRWRGLLDAPAV